MVLMLKITKNYKSIFKRFCNDVLTVVKSLPNISKTRIEKLFSKFSVVTKTQALFFECYIKNRRGASILNLILRKTSTYCSCVDKAS